MTKLRTILTKLQKKLAPAFLPLSVIAGLILVSLIGIKSIPYFKAIANDKKNNSQSSSQDSKQISSKIEELRISDQNGFVIKGVPLLSNTINYSLINKNQQNRISQNAYIEITRINDLLGCIENTEYSQRQKQCENYRNKFVYYETEQILLGINQSQQPSSDLEKQIITLIKERADELHRYYIKTNTATEEKVKAVNNKIFPQDSYKPGLYKNIFELPESDLKKVIDAQDLGIEGLQNKSVVVVFFNDYSSDCNNLSLELKSYLDYYGTEVAVRTIVVEVPVFDEVNTLKGLNIGELKNKYAATNCSLFSYSLSQREVKNNLITDIKDLEKVISILDQARLFKV